jgi:hypothetical protein
MQGSSGSGGDAGQAQLQQQQQAGAASLDNDPGFAAYMAKAKAEYARILSESAGTGLVSKADLKGKQVVSVGESFDDGSDIEASSQQDFDDQLHEAGSQDPLASVCPSSCSCCC